MSTTKVFCLVTEILYHIFYPVNSPGRNLISKGLTQSETTNRQGRPAADLHAQPAPAASNFRFRELPLGQYGQRRLQPANQSVRLGYGCTPDGIFGQKTHSAVIWYQSNNGLSVDGIAGTKTLAKIKEDVTTVQQQLGDLGYNAGKADGIFGPTTRSAVKSFQSDYNLTADGIAGSKTRAALAEAVKNSNDTDSDTGTQDDLDKLRQYIKDNWISPIRAEYLPITGGRSFGYKRSDGRQHAGIDFFVVDGAGTPVYAMTDGTVTATSTTFYAGTGAVTVKNNDGTVVRYGEITPAVSNGRTVRKGQIIGYLAKNNNDGGTMLHLELYRGDAEGILTRVNTDYWYVSGNYNRRSDLLNPTEMGIG